MNRNVLVAAVSVALLAAAPAPASAAAPAGGQLCDAVSVLDPQAEEDDVETAVVWGGPLDAADEGSTISMRCSIQGGWWNDRHSGADALSVSSPPSAGSTFLPPARESYVLPRGHAYLCTEATVDGTTYYFDGDSDTWSTSSEALCYRAFAPTREVGNLLNSFCEVDLCLPPEWLISCPVLASVFPPEGDIPGVWDCPPYGT